MVSQKAKSLIGSEVEVVYQLSSREAGTIHGKLVNLVNLSQRDVFIQMVLEEEGSMRYINLAKIISIKVIKPKKEKSEPERGVEIS
jgi:hypothetical protein